MLAVRMTGIFMLLGAAVGMLLFPTAALADFGIQPGKVYIDNLHPGTEADIAITIRNQGDSKAVYQVSARKPDYTDTGAGYESFPYLDWVTITPDQVTIGARDDKEVLVVIVMPKDADYSGKKAEVWISFMEQGTPDMIKVELCSRLFISTRAEATNKTPPAQDNSSTEITTGALENGQTEEKPSSRLSAWTIVGPVLGVVLAGGATFFLMKRRQHA